MSEFCSCFPAVSVLSLLLGILLLTINSLFFFHSDFFNGDTLFFQPSLSTLLFLGYIVCQGE